MWPLTKAQITEQSNNKEGIARPFLGIHAAREGKAAHKAQ
jgi:hypothetical protein